MFSQTSQEYETRTTKEYKSYDPEIGYNFFIGDNKPIDGANKIAFEQKRSIANRNRCTDGSQRKADGTNNLPANIYYVYRKDGEDGKVLAGYKVQITDSNKKLHMKAFTKNDMSMEEKLQMAKNYLSGLKEQIVLVVPVVENFDGEISKPLSPKEKTIKRIYNLVKKREKSLYIIDTVQTLLEKDIVGNKYFAKKLEQ
jgi:hypothetical protein